MQTSWGVVDFARIGIEFRVVSIAANQESGETIASGWTDWGSDRTAAETNERYVRNLLVMLGMKSEEAEIFMGEDLI
jgi:hypothetical protein